MGATSGIGSGAAGAGGRRPAQQGAGGPEVAPGSGEPSGPIEPSRTREHSRPNEASGAAGAKELLFPWGARGVPMPGGLLADLDRLVWAPCPGRQAPALGWDPVQPFGDAPAGEPGRDAPPGRRGGDQDGRDPTLFESALVTLLAQPVGSLGAPHPSALHAPRVTAT